MSRKAVLKSIESERIIKSSIYWSYQQNLRLGINYDYRKDIYDTVKLLTINDLNQFFDNHIKSKNYTFLVIGNKKNIDMEILEKLGEYKELTLEEVFGY